jgi:hypothetical protein
MKKIYFVSMLVCIALFVNGQEQKPFLELQVESKVQMQNEPFYIKLIIHDQGLKDSIAQNGLGLADYDFLDKNSDEFSCSVKVVPKDTGNIKIGPYKINYQGKKLISNSIYINVKAKESNTVYFKVTPGAEPGESGTIQIISEGDKSIDLKLKKSEYFAITGTSSSQSINIDHGKTKTRYSLTYSVVFLKEGTLTLSGDSFEKKPEGVAVEPATIVIMKTMEI